MYFLCILSFLFAINHQSLGEKHFLFSSLYQSDLGWKELVDDQKWAFCENVPWIAEKECWLYREMAMAQEAAMVYAAQAKNCDGKSVPELDRLKLIAAQPVIKNHDQILTQQDLRNTLVQAYGELRAEYARPMEFGQNVSRIVECTKKWALQKGRQLLKPATFVCIGSNLTWANVFECEMVNSLVKIIDEEEEQNQKQDQKDEKSAKKVAEAVEKLTKLEAELAKNPTLEGQMGGMAKFGKMPVRLWHGAYEWHRPKFGENDLPSPTKREVDEPKPEKADPTKKEVEEPKPAEKAEPTPVEG